MLLEGVEHPPILVSERKSEPILPQGYQGISVYSYGTERDLQNSLHSQIIFFIQ
jgi:hypothetical protein